MVADGIPSPSSREAPAGPSRGTAYYLLARLPRRVHAWPQRVVVAKAPRPLAHARPSWQQGQADCSSLAFQKSRHMAWKVWPQRVVATGSPSRGTGGMRPRQTAHSHFSERVRLDRVVMRRRVQSAQSTWVSLVPLNISQLQTGMEAVGRTGTQEKNEGGVVCWCLVYTSCN